MAIPIGFRWVIRAMQEQQTGSMPIHRAQWAGITTAVAGFIRAFHFIEIKLAAIFIMWIR